MILAHVNALVESGYSANEDVLVENMSEGTLVARILVLWMRKVFLMLM